MTTDEIRQVLKKIKSGKAPGLGNFPLKLIKAAPSILYDVIA